MSEPWPPAFILTAPPTEPGTPTAHSNPVRPERRRAPGEHRQRDAAAGRAPRVPSSTSTARRHGRRSRRRCRRTRRRRRAGWSHSPTTSTGRPDARRAAATASRSSSVRGAHEQGCGATDAVRRQRAERLVALGAVPELARPRRRWPSSDAATAVIARPPCRPPGEHLLGQRGDVAAAHRDAHVAAADLAGEERHDVLAAAAATRTRARGWASTTALTMRRPGDARDRRRPRRVDLGDHDDVGADEGVAVLLPHLGDAVVAVRLEGDDHPLPTRRRCRGPRRSRRRSRPAGGRSRRRTWRRRRRRGCRSGGRHRRSGPAPRGSRRTSTPSSSAIAIAPVALTTLCTPRSGSSTSPRRSPRRSTANENEPAVPMQVDGAHVGAGRPGRTSSPGAGSPGRRTPGRRRTAPAVRRCGRGSGRSSPAGRRTCRSAGGSRARR